MGSASTLGSPRGVEERDFNDTYLVDVALLPAALLVTSLDEVGALATDLIGERVEVMPRRARHIRSRAEDFINWRDHQRS